MFTNMHDDVADEKESRMFHVSMSVVYVEIFTYYSLKRRAKVCIYEKKNIHTSIDFAS
jgi:hypothetical protein